MGRGSGGTRSLSFREPDAFDSVSFEDNIITYVRDNENEFSKSDIAYIKSNMERVSTMYRFLDEGSKESYLKVGDTLKYDTVRSFSKGTDGLAQTLTNASDFADIDNGVVLQVDGGKGFNIKDVVSKNKREFGYMAQDYIRQNEHLSIGSYKVTEVTRKTYSNTIGEEYSIKTIKLKQVK